MTVVRPVIAAAMMTLDAPMSATATASDTGMERWMQTLVVTEAKHPLKPPAGHLTDFPPGREGHSPRL
jgi:hypothetical protein